MRWEGLFADLEAQMGRELTLEEGAVAAEERRHAVGRQTFADAVAGLGIGTPIAVVLRGGESVRVETETVGADWIAAREIEMGRALLIPCDSVESITLPVHGRATAPTTPTRVRLRMVLRDLARRRSPVLISVGARRIHGTIDAVGLDHLRVALHPHGTARRRGEVTAFELISLAAISCVGY